MRHVFLILVAALALTVASCRKNDIRTFEVTVPEMKSEADVKAVMTSLQPLSGIGSDGVKVDLKARIVTVTYDSMQTSRKNIEHAIAYAGYAANDIPANPTTVGVPQAVAVEAPAVAAPAVEAPAPVVEAAP